MQTLYGVLALAATKQSKKMNQVGMGKYNANIATHLPVSNVRSSGMKAKAVRGSNERNFSVSSVFQMCASVPNVSRLFKRMKGALTCSVLAVTTISAGVAWDPKIDMTDAQCILCHVHSFHTTFG